MVDGTGLHPSRGTAGTARGARTDCSIELLGLAIRPYRRKFSQRVKNGPTAAVELNEFLRLALGIATK
jgi:hypothetical protein